MNRALRILAVDNEPSVTLSLRYVFPEPRYETICADSGNAALTRLDSDPTPYDVIILDEKMPQLTGTELVGEIRKRGIKGKIVVVSAYLTPETREAYERMNVQVMFSKPFNIDVLRTAVDRLVV